MQHSIAARAEARGHTPSTRDPLGEKATFSGPYPCGDLVQYAEQGIASAESGEKHSQDHQGHNRRYFMQHKERNEKWRRVSACTLGQGA